MTKYIKLLSTVAPLFLTLVGCAPKNYTGFLPGSLNATPIQESYENQQTMPPISLDRPSERIVLIYNHGTTDGDIFENCKRSYNKVPNTLKAITDKDILIYYLCSDENATSVRGKPGAYVDNRNRELKSVVDDMLAAGVLPKHLFLTGHSAGGWISLEAVKYKEKFNSIVVFAPAFAGRKSFWQDNQDWREERAKRLGSLQSSETPIEALMFAYYRDPFETPESLRPLRESHSETIDFFGYDCHLCFGIHSTHLKDCQEDDTIDRIRNYIFNRTCMHSH